MTDMQYEILCLMLYPGSTSLPDSGQITHYVHRVPAVFRLG